MNPRALRNGALLGTALWALLFVALRAAAQPALDCQPLRTVPSYFADRREFRWCIPPQPAAWTWPRSEWQILRQDKPTPTWVDIAATIGSDLTITVPQWARFQIRYRGCNPFTMNYTCSPWSEPSPDVSTGPNVDVDGSGVVTTFDYTRTCRDFIQKVVNRRLDEGEYK